MCAAGRWVLHLDMDAFFASVEQLTRPTLRDRPVLVGGTGGRGVVAGASYEARVFGARSAMPMHQARRLVGINAVVLPPRGAVYGVASRRVFATVRSMIPVLEQLSFDEAFGEPAELAGATVASVAEYVDELRARVLAETGLTASVGAGSGKQIAKIASGLAKPDGVRIIASDVQRALLDDLPVRKLWGIGPVAEERLNRLGINTIGQLAALQTSEVASVLGSTIGPALHQLARGIDERPVAERAETKQISAESTFADDLTTLDQLREAIEPIGAHAHRRLVKHGRGVRTVTVKLRRADMSILTRSATLPYATTERSILMSAARRLLLDPVEIGPIRLVGVGFSGFSDVQQTSLFPDLDQSEPVAETNETSSGTESAPTTASWHIGDDVGHSDFGHGWIQGAGHGVMTVRFETRSSGPGFARTFPVDDPGITYADPVASLDWFVQSAEPLDDGEDV
ncbi:MAG: DNA polymerase IV [Mycobacterium sp.]